jgi:hypothetical protein
MVRGTRLPMLTAATNSAAASRWRAVPSGLAAASVLRCDYPRLAERQRFRRNGVDDADAIRAWQAC